MASQQQDSAGSPPSAQVVGNAFVHQYYNILYQSPELVHKFYQESSKLGRPEAQGVMSSITSTQAINEKILSMDYGGLSAEIKTVDAQESLSGGVLVLVTGYLTGNDNIRRNFTQSFFLAPQDKGYFVLNDIFRYVEEVEHLQGNQTLPNGASVPHPIMQEAPQQPEEQYPEQSEPPPLEEVIDKEVCSTSELEEYSVVEETPISQVVDEDPYTYQATAAESVSPTTQEEVPKKSYASILKVMKENAAASSVLPSAPTRPVTVIAERQAAPALAPTPAAEIPAASPSVPETSSVQDPEADSHSVYVKSLPLNATPAQLEEEFKRFGPIKPGGVQVRSHKQQGFCFGFVEFEAASSVQSAIEASPVTIGGRQAFVEEKRPPNSRVSSRGRFSGRGGFRNEGGRGRGSYNGGRGYGRGDFGNRTDFGGRGGSVRGGSSNSGDGTAYQRVDHGGPISGRGGRSSSAVAGSPKAFAPKVPASA